MAIKAFNYSRFISGLTDFSKEGVEYGVPSGSYFFARNLDVRSDPRSVQLLPRTVKSSGSVVTDLIKWFEVVNEVVYGYGDTGNIYERNTSGTYSYLATANTSHGNGLGYFGEDDYLYYTQDSTIGRYGPLSLTPQFTDDFLGAQGGVPLNTNSILLNGSSQYASRADTASLSITGDLAISAWINPTTIPTSAGDSQVFVSKWTEDGNERSYRFEVYAISGYFGDGSDGALTVSSNTTESPVDSACTGTSGATSLSATNASFAAGQIILIHQSQGSGAGSWQRNVIAGYTSGTITLQNALNTNYVSGAQVRVMPQYSSVTVNSGITYTAKSWAGTVGGILAFLSSGSVTVTGTIEANGGDGAISTAGSGGGFRGGATANGAGAVQYQGEGTSGTGSQSHSANGSGGGGGKNEGSGDYSTGGGGGNSAQGTNGYTSPGGMFTSISGVGGASSGSADLTTMTFGGGGGGGASIGTTQPYGGGSGGGILFITATTITVTGGVTANGGAGGGARDGNHAGAGAGGSVLIKAQMATLGSDLVTADKGTTPWGSNGADGRVHLDYLTSYTGTTSPTLDVAQDNTLVTTVSNQLRLGVSSNGTAEEYLTANVTLSTGMWQQVAVSWDASASTATFYLNGVSVGTSVGTATAIDDNASVFNVGRFLDDGSSTDGLYDGYIDEVRVFASTRSADDIVAGLTTQISASTPGLATYYQFNGDADDETSNSNDLTATGSPTYPADVPFASPSTRLDIDQQQTESGQTYTTPTAISESATNRLTFTPEVDPQKSIAFLIASVGTGDWTVTLHDQFNRTVATVTVANADLFAGYYEFIYSNQWRPVLNDSYHAHITSTVADGTVTTGTTVDLETVSYRTYFAFLVTDTDFHPTLPMLNFLAFGNERYIATWQAALYQPNKVTLAPGHKTRCLGYWREFMIAGTWLGDNITDYDKGRLYFWDGISDTFNFFVDVPEGGVNAVIGSKGKLYVMAGYQGDLIVYQGGDSAEEVKRLPYVAEDKYVEIFPGAMTMWKTLIRIGVGGNTDSTIINQAVYTYGRTNASYTDALTCDYTISTGNVGSSVKIGALTSVNGKLLTSWQDGVGYGVDEVDSSNDVYASGKMIFNIEDGGGVWKQKQLLSLVSDFAEISSGQSVVLGYSLNRDTVFTNINSSDVPSSGDVVSTFPTNGVRFKELQVQVQLTTSVSTSPVVYDVVAEYDDLTKERKVGGL